MEIDLCRLKALNWSNLVLQQSLYHCIYHNNSNGMLFSSRFCLITENTILPQHLNTANDSLNFFRIEENISDLSKIWDNRDGCTDHYICDTALFLLKMLSHAYNKIIDHCVSAPGHGIEMFDGHNATKEVNFKISCNCETAWF